MTIDEGFRAERAWTMIQRNPKEITFEKKDGTDITRTVRVSVNNAARDKQSDGVGAVSSRSAIVFGVRNHPDDAVPDTTIERGDQFELDTMIYRIVDVHYPPGQVQADAEAIS